MPNTDNLKSYKPGESGNPNGRPKGSRNVSTVLAHMLGEIAPEIVVDKSFVKDVSKHLSNPTIADAVAARLIYEGIVNGNLGALREVLDRTEGKAKQSVEISNHGDIETIVKAFTRLLARKAEKGEELPKKNELRDLVERASKVNDVDPNEIMQRLEMV